MDRGGYARATNAYPPLPFSSVAAALNVGCRVWCVIVTGERWRELEEGAKMYVSFPSRVVVSHARRDGCCSVVQTVRSAQGTPRRIMFATENGSYSRYELGIRKKTSSLYFSLYAYSDIAIRSFLSLNG